MGRCLDRRKYPFRFSALPPELRRLVLEYTDLVTPLCEVEWSGTPKRAITFATAHRDVAVAGIVPSRGLARCMPVSKLLGVLTHWLLLPPIPRRLLTQLSLLGSSYVAIPRKPAPTRRRSRGLSVSATASSSSLLQVAITPQPV